MSSFPTPEKGVPRCNHEAPSVYEQDLTPMGHPYMTVLVGCPSCGDYVVGESLNPTRRRWADRCATNQHLLEAQAEENKK